MSAPTPAPGDDRPREGYYPDPSIPGYVRYWNGASWVPGTSRPAPGDGESLAPPPGAGAAQPGSVEETGPHFFDEDPVEEPAETPSAADAQHGNRPEPASAWGADRSRQSGFGGGQDRRISWGAPQGAQGVAPQGARGGDPRLPHADQRSDEEPARADGTADVPPADREAQAAAGGSTFVFRRPAGQPGGGAAPADAPDDGTMTFRAVPPRPGPAGAGAKPGGDAAAADGSRGGSAGPGFGPVGADGPGSGPAVSGFGAQGGAGGSGFGPAGSGGASAAPGAGGQAGAPGGGFGPAGPGSGPAAPAFGGRTASPGTAGSPSGPAFGAQAGPTGSGSGSAGPGFGAGKAAAARASAAQAAAGSTAAQASGAAPTALSGPQAAPTVPPQSGGPASAQPAASAAPLSPGPGGGQSSWAQQVHRLAGSGGGDEQPVAPWKPPVEDVFQAAARRQAEARPAGLGKRLVARLLDTVVLAALTATAAVPLGTKAIDHIEEKIDAARLSGETVTVWLLDGTTSVYLGIILAVLLLAGVLCEVLPTAKWGRTLGKKLMGLDVRDIEGHESPEFGAALRRWLVYSVPGLLVVGIVGMAWCLFDRPWRQCWHDKAAHTFVAG
ncbi:membrane protein [Streptomyces sp. NRRL B-1140]|uniref:RDD family protein n=1 Tax=Streptomyces sp. NRRL B-1140 TaxID=1415549 RepID=UPI0006C58DB4|nr:RDD family protein [Streptomyces sp. NRRL B-1140]KOX00977.1 membrane protein [Streptomyces sp. NRRL B-1140]